MHRKNKAEKPYRGELHHWERKYINKDLFPEYDYTLGYVLYGEPHNHPYFKNWIMTSAVVDYDETTGEIETLHSIYKLVPPRKSTSPEK